jgi:D-glycero-D-manno-heptose 1,7-bisphosphate phosphatase
MKPAVFLDRDGTVIRQVHYLSNPADVELIPGAARALRDLRAAGFACVVVSNQSAVGRGMLTLEGVARVQEEFERQLAAEDAAIDGWYFCPAAPSTTDRTTVEHPDRKPAPGMLLRASRDLCLDVASSWMVGDMISDLLAGRNAGCRGSILVRTGYGAEATDAAAIADHVADDLLAAAIWILEQRQSTAATPRSKTKGAE